MRHLIWILVTTLAAGSAYFLGLSHKKADTLGLPEKGSLTARDNPSARKTTVELTSKAESGLVSVFDERLSVYMRARGADESTLRSLISEYAMNSNQALRMNALETLFTRYAELNALGAMEYIGSRYFEDDVMVRDVVLRQWARANLDAMLAYARTQQIPGNEIFYAIVTARTDLSDAELRQIGHSLVMMVDVEQVLATHTRQGPASSFEEAWARAVSTEQNAQKYWRQFSVLQNWARHDPTAALEALRVANPTISKQMLPHVIKTWAAGNPDEAIAWVASADSNFDRSVLVRSLVDGLAATQPQRAHAFVEGLTGVDHSLASQALFDGWAKGDPEAALRWVTGQNQFQVREWAFTQAVGRFVNRSPEDALSWSLELSNQGARMAVPLALTKIAETDLNRALQILTTITDTQISSLASKRLLTHVIQESPQRAMDWVMAMGTDQKAAVFPSLAQRWYAMDAPAAEQAVFAQTDVGLRDASVLAILNNLSNDPEAAELLYRRMSTEDAREKARKWLFQTWSRLDAQRAIQYEKSSEP